MNKKITLLVAFLVVSLAGFAQVGIGTTTPDASAALDVTATDKGFLMPRMTTAQRTAIASPATGLQVYDTDTKSFWSYDGAAWKEGDGTGKFVDGATPEIAYYNNRVGIGIDNFSTVHKLYVKGVKDTDGTNTSVRIDADYTGTGTSIATYGLAAYARNLGSATVGFAIGTQGIVNNENTAGSMTTGVSTYPQLNNKGTMGFGGGVFAAVNNFGTMTQAEGFGTTIFNDAGKQIDSVFMSYLNVSNNGTINKTYGLFIENQGTGTTTNTYAVYIKNNFNKGTADNFAIYSDTNADSYFNGNIGAGIKAPQRKVHISGAMRLEPQAVAPANASLGDLYVNTDGKLYFYDGTSWREVQLI
jgi:hypothetical protein